jgi:hypothetical protein
MSAALFFPAPGDWARNHPLSHVCAPCNTHTCPYTAFVVHSLAASYSHIGRATFLVELHIIQLQGGKMKHVSLNWKTDGSHGPVWGPLPSVSNGRTSWHGIASLLSRWAFPPNMLRNAVGHIGSRKGGQLCLVVLPHGRYVTRSASIRMLL